MRNRLSHPLLMILSALFLMACLALPGETKAHPQDSQTQPSQSVADAARRSREQKKNAAKQSRVIGNEDLDSEYFKPGQEGLNLSTPAGSQEGAHGSAGASAVVPGNDAANAANKDPQVKDKDSEEAAAEDAEIARMKDQIAEAEKQLKWQQRELALDQDTVYSNPNYTDSHSGKAKLDAEQQQIKEKQQEIEGLKTQLSTLQERRAQTAPAKGAPPGQ